MRVEDLADLTSRSPSHIRNVENGLRHCPADLLVLIADTLGVHADDLSGPGRKDTSS